LGASSNQWDSLAQHVLEKKAPVEMALELGLIRPSKKDAQGKTPGIGYYDLFRNRAMFPILDLRGRVAGFGGRILPAEQTGESSASNSKDDGPKYLNSAESFIFQKSKLAYGLFQAQKHIREADEVVLVEGYFDVLALHAAGFQNAVAICGTSLTADHLQIFTRFGKKVTLLLDSDAAGLAATERAMELGLEKGLILYGAQVPEGLDPDEILFDQKTGAPLPGGVEKMKAILGGSAPLLDQKIEIELAEALKSPEARVQALKKLGGWLSRFRDPVGKEVRIDQIQKRLGVSRHLLSQAFGQNLGPEISQRGPERGFQPGFQGRRPAPQPFPVGREARSKTQASLSKRDVLLLTAVVRGKEGAQVIADHRKLWPSALSISDLFDYIPVRSFMETLFKEPGAFERFRADPKAILETGFGSQEGPLDAQVRSTITEALISPDAPFEPEEIKMALDRAVGRALERISQRLHSAIADAEAKKDAGLEAQLKKEYLDVQRKLKEFNTFYDEA
jgi:DNA primase